MKKNKRFVGVKFPLFAFLVVISGAMLAFSTHSFLSGFKEFGFSIFSSVQKGVYTAFSSVAKTVSAVEELAILQRDYEVLANRLENYEYLQRNNAEIRKENARLREQLDFTETLTRKNISAFIIGRDPNAMYSAITLDKGMKHGIRKNMSVIAIQNGNVGLVGKIVEVGRTTSVVMPLYDSHFHVSSRIQTTRDIGLVSGNGSETSGLAMKYIKKRVFEELQKGDVVVTSGENNNFDRDIPIGTISRITELDYDTSLEIALTPIIDFSRLEMVIVTEIQNHLDDD